MLTHHFADPDIVYQLRNKPEEKDKAFQWPNVVVNARVKNYSKQAPESAFSIISNQQGKAGITVNGKDLRVCENTFFILNPFQSFEYQVDSEEEVKTLNVHFNFDYYQNALFTLMYSDEKLLDNPEENSVPDHIFIEQLHYKNQFLRDFLNNYSEEDKDSYFMEVLSHALLLDEKSQRYIHNVRSKKPCTQKELLRRMLLAKDILYSSYDKEDFDIGYLSSQVAMSKYHFLRVFKQIFGITPYQMLKNVRMTRARYLLENTDLFINEIALQVGYSEPNAIYPAAKKYLNSSPSELRKISNFR